MAFFYVTFFIEYKHKLKIIMNSQRQGVFFIDNNVKEDKYRQKYNSKYHILCKINLNLHISKK